MKIKWSGLADEKYYNYIAKYCLPSWKKLPGEKYIVHDSNKINQSFLNVVDWKDVGNYSSPFWKIQTSRKKTNNFWRKMQSQVWAGRNLRDCDFIVLLDTDIEVLDFDNALFNQSLEEFKSTNCIWATGKSNSRLHDSGFIILNANHRDLDTLLDYYENIWNSGEIFNLKKSYDGNAVESMFDLYPSYKFKNTDYGKGLHVYDIGLVHYGSKIPKQMRSTCETNPEKMIEDYIKGAKIKHYKN